MLNRRQQEQIPFALALTVTRLARRVEAGLVQSMARQFDRPTSYTLSSTFATMATKAEPVAEVGMKADPEGKARIGPADVLRQEFAGGIRRHKAMEGLLTSAGLMSAGEYLAPFTLQGGAAQLDQHGNPSRGQVMKILSQLRATTDPEQWRKATKRRKRSAKGTQAPQLERYFWSRGGRLARGVWRRDGRNVRPVYLVVTTPQYEQRINLPAIAEDVVARYRDEEFVQALVQALRSAGEIKGRTRAQRSAAGRRLWQQAVRG